ncbi:unnamed protein product [Clonostachys chloroleuca]|uniref:UBX domain-containing protein n=1 Tax=Clonostachys chloroleuca TaxID=1926264 RepID=A0AA35PWN7_9HYPO|nr:unnamed protein product [Clonostachys chloroleuca]
MEAEEAISTFAGITGASPEVAQGFLALTGNNVERAIELFFENPDLVSNVQSGVSGNPPPVPTSTRPNIGRQDSTGVIHIDSDEDDVMDLVDDDDDDDRGHGRQAAIRTAALAQEEEDAAMAKRLQEELYGGPGSGSGSGTGEDVRAPIARTTETLVAPDLSWAPDDGMESAILSQLRQQRQRRRGPPRSGGPFAQRIWGESSSPAVNTEDSGGDGTGSHARRLADLFRPPYELMERDVSWDEARDLGKEDKKWIMVNLQDMSDFNCQTLNRDIWKDEAVKSLVAENFVFLQYDKEYPDSQEFITFYFPNQSHENRDNYPHVSIIDPRTGEQVKVWSGIPFPSAREFHAEIAEFLDRYSLAANSKNPVAKATARKPQPIDVERMTEDEMLEMALKNSLAGAEGSSGSGSTPNLHDPDALTKSPTAGADTPEGKGKEPEPVAEESAFAKISSSNPHTEPENDPKTTTRIQLRHPNGRVIRRFQLQDSVRRIYEWLKAEPMEGKDGVEFELKMMPQGQDLIETLDATIEEAGLKQGTVMIEFIED